MRFCFVITISWSIHAGEPSSPELATHPSVSITETPIMELSATFIRQAIKDKKSIRFFVPDSVIEFIESKSLYS